MTDFAERVALVTGAGRGLGFAYARSLAALGATVILQDSGTASDGQGRDPAVAEAAAASIVAEGGRCTPSSMHISSRVECGALVSGIIAQHGRLDILIHNAGWVGYQAIEELEADFLDRVVRLGIDTPLWLVQAAWPKMREAAFGRILLTTSDRAIYPQYAQEGLCAYAAAKMAAVGIVNSLAIEGASHGITVNAISPVAKTRMWGADDKPDELRPEAVAPGALYLVSAGCTVSGWILRASNGQFAATQAREAAGVNYPRDLTAVRANTPEQVAAAWSRIAVARPEARSGTSEPSVAVASAAVLGESPVLDASTGTLLWVDTEGQTLNRLDIATGMNAAIGLPDVVGMVAERGDGATVVALGCDLAEVARDGAIHRIATAPDAHKGFRLNDGRFDAAGRLWIGLMDKALRPESGVLYRYDPDGVWHEVDRGFTLVNGLDWSPDKRTLYVTDSRASAIYSYDYDPATGTVGQRRTFARFAPEEGFPDGLLVGPEGEVWSTLFDGGAIQRIEADGRRTKRIELPVTRPTSCAFSADGEALYVTTARLGLDDDALKKQPLAGAVIKVRCDARR